MKGGGLASLHPEWNHLGLWETVHQALLAFDGPLAELRNGLLHGFGRISTDDVAEAAQTLKPFLKARGGLADRISGSGIIVQALQFVLERLWQIAGKEDTGRNEYLGAADWLISHMESRRAARARMILGA